MANTTFRLNKGLKISDSKKPVPIYLRFTFGRDLDFNASIKFRASINQWDANKQRIRNKTSIPHRHKANELMEKLSLHFTRFYNDNAANGTTPTIKDARKHFEAFFTPSKPVQQENLWEYIENLIEGPETQRNLTPESIRSYKNTYSVLVRFKKDTEDFDFDDINIDWYNEFYEWCIQQGFKDNYFGKHIKNLKAILNRALEDKKTTNTNHISKRFKTVKKNVDSIYLNIDELNKISELNLTGREEQARDLFLIGAYTGLRVSDFNALSNDNVTSEGNKKYINIKTKKTGKKVVIPMHPIVESIFKKYNGAPAKIPNQHINKLIKEICKKAGIDQKVKTGRIVGGKEKFTYLKKYEMVSCHTARRSFCTNAYKERMNTMDIMAISGHTSEKTLLLYIKVTPEERAKNLSTHKVFNN